MEGSPAVARPGAGARQGDRAGEKLSPSSLSLSLSLLPSLSGSPQLSLSLSDPAGGRRRHIRDLVLRLFGLESLHLALPRDVQRSRAPAPTCGHGLEVETSRSGRPHPGYVVVDAYGCDFSLSQIQLRGEVTPWCSSPQTNVIDAASFLSLLMLAPCPSKARKGCEGHQAPNFRSSLKIYEEDKLGVK